MSIPLTAKLSASLAVAFLSTLIGCSGSSSPSPVLPISEQTHLLRTDYGRLVDIYAFRRIDIATADRRATSNREYVLIKRNAVIDPSIETEDLFDAIGDERITADFRYMSFDNQVGHDELVILWDDTNPSEKDRFDSAMRRATESGLIEVPASYRDQNLLTNPMPVVPRNAAFRLTFDRPLKVDASFFDANPGALQLLRIKGDPNIVGPAGAFEQADRRILVEGNTIIVDTTLLAGETRRGRTSVGLVPSQDNRTANYRIAMPAQGVISKAFHIDTDTVATLNGPDSRGDASVIRDFRSGNTQDGKIGALSDYEAPTLTAYPSLGILAVDTETRILTISKRGHDFALRGRTPFVDGGVDPDSGLPAGPDGIPTVDQNGIVMPLPSADTISQTVITENGPVRIRAEIIEVLEVGTILGDARFAGIGLTASGTDGGELPVIHVRVSTIHGIAQNGDTVTFEADGNNPLGADAKARIRYYQHLRYSPLHGNHVLSDSQRRGEFQQFTPKAPRLHPITGQPLPISGRRQQLDPMASVLLPFSEPMDMSAIDNYDNFFFTTQDAHIGNIGEVLAEPKSATLSMLASRLVDRFGDGTHLMLTPPYGFYHQASKQETYWFHIDLTSNAMRDLAGNALDLYDRRPAGTETVAVTGQPNASYNVPLEFFSVEFSLADDAQPNLVSSRVFRFADIDEDGSKPGSFDYSGQFRIEGGSLRAAETVRRQFTADGQNLGSILRWDKGECVTPGTPPTSTPPPLATQTSFGPGNLYWTPSMSAVQSAANVPNPYKPPTGQQSFGGIVEPHTARGSHMQMTYREDDFGLAYREMSDLNLDVEQLHWAPWDDMTVLFDTFDRYTMTLSHSKKRPDLSYLQTTTVNAPLTTATHCALDCASLFSGLNTTFESNYLEGAPRVKVIEDARYTINPNDAFRSTSGFKFVPYPTFEKTFTWRDHRIVSWDSKRETATGLGGAIDAVSAPSLTGGGDSTASVSSPWIEDDIWDNWTFPVQQGTTPPTKGALQGWMGTQLTRDYGDFLGDRTLDHDPIALPLLVDLMVFPDDTQSSATAGNLFHIAYVGPTWTTANNNGYYNAGSGYTTFDPVACSNIDWPFFRVHSSGGIDPNTGEYLVVPDLELAAKPSWIKDMGLGNPTSGLVQTKPGDSHLHWAAMDTVRRVSVVTLGFFDTLQPNSHDLAQSGFPGLPPSTGRPSFQGQSLRVQDMDIIVDPPLSAQAGGTSIKVEVRGLATMPQGQDGIYDRTGGALHNNVSDGGRMGQMNLLLNPNYACEAYRYAMANPGSFTTTVAGISTPRIAVTGLTPYVEVDDLAQLRDANTGLLPRYLNLRCALENNTASNPAVSPSMRSMAVIMRMAPNQ